MIRRFVILFLTFSVPFISMGADIIPDDHGNVPADATSLVGSSNAVAGVIDYNTDLDYFSIPFYPARAYVIHIRTGTVKDISLKITPPFWSSPYFDTNTIWDTPVDINWTNDGILGTWSIKVEGMFNYTTGTYNMAIWEAEPNQDVDGDGMTDSWETNSFGSITNMPDDDADGDGQTNWEEFNAQTDGGDAGSAVQIDSIDKQVNEDDLVGWYQAAFSIYKIYSSTNVYGPWLYLSDNMAGGTSGSILWTNDPGGSDIRFYRVEFVY